MVKGLVGIIRTGRLSPGLLLLIGIHVQMTSPMGIISKSLSGKWVSILDTIIVILFLAVTFRMNGVDLVVNLCRSTLF